MVSKLQDIGYPMSICANVSRPNMDAAVARGAHEVATPHQVAAAGGIIMLCMDTTASVGARMRGPDAQCDGCRTTAIGHGGFC